MHGYRVVLTRIAALAITDTFAYISVEAASPMNAHRWLRLLYRRLDDLSSMPHRFPVAPEAAARSAVTRHALVGSHRLVFEVDDENRVVTIISLRHGHEDVAPDG